MNQSKPVLVSDAPSSVLALDDKKYSRLGWLLVLGGFAGFLGWAALAPLDKGVAVPGKVMVSGHRKTVQHPAGGIVERIDAQQRRRAFDLLQGIAQVGAGQQQTRFGVGDDRQQTLLMVAARRFRRIRRHCDHARIQATKKRRDVIRAAGKQQHRAISKSRLSLQRGSNRARALIEFAIAEHHSLFFVFGKKTQGQLIRRQGRAALEGLDQSAGDVERVGHEVSCLESAC